jgi:ketosteroid isomerase-like protein
MSEENVDALRAAFEMYARGDFSPIRMLGDDFELVVAPNAPEANTYRGEEARNWLREWVSTFQGTEIEATEIIDSGDKVLLGYTMQAHPPGSAAPFPMKARWWQVSTFRGTKIVKAEMFTNRSTALEASGLSE